jgi:pyrimidine operon attenuation protein/uracil phosphoribosyltransferase
MTPTPDRNVLDRVVLDSAEIARAITRIAHEIVERTRGAHDLVLLGIPTRGVPLATRLGARIDEITAKATESADGTGMADESPRAPVSVGSLDVTMFRDDLRMQPARPLLPTSLPAGGIDGKLVILVDDVLFSGRTIRAALDALGDSGRPRAVSLAVLVDRGHRELPIRADYVGKNIPTSRSESVHVCLVEYDGIDVVRLEGS